MLHFWPDPSHPTLGNHEAPKPFFMLHFFPSQAFPTPLLGAMKHPNPFSCFIFGRTLPTPRLGTMKHPNPFSCFIFFPSQAFPTPLLGTMRNASTPFHVSLLAFPSPSHPTLGNHDYMNSGFRSPLLRSFSPVSEMLWLGIWKSHNSGWLDSRTESGINWQCTDPLKDENLPTSRSLYSLI